MANDQNDPERPRLEPEIIPPDRPRQGNGWGRPPWPPYGGTHRVYVTRVGPFGAAMLMLAIALLAAVFFLAIVGAVLIWIPVVLLFVAVAAVYRLLR